MVGGWVGRVSFTNEVIHTLHLNDDRETAVQISSGISFHKITASRAKPATKIPFRFV